LQHDGYVETARAFAEEIHTEKKALSLDDTEIEGINIKDDEDANSRQRIRRAILEGDIDRALRYTNEYYPHVLKDNEQVYFRLRCRKFVEMIRKEAELNQAIKKRGMTPKRYSSALEDDEEMTEADESSTWGEEMDTEDGLDGGVVVSKLSQEALLYGQELRSEFHADPRREVSKHLDEIFALIAYPNPLEVKEVAHLLDRTGRVAVAEELNSAILRKLASP
jgi:Ran-binding protein 9/10